MGHVRSSAQSISAPHEQSFLSLTRHTSQRPEIAPREKAVPSLRALERVETSETEPILLRGRKGWWSGGGRVSSLLREEPIRSKMLVSAKDEGVCKDSDLLSNGRLGEAGRLTEGMCGQFTCFRSARK